MGLFKSIASALVTVATAGTVSMGNHNVGDYVRSDRVTNRERYAAAERASRAESSRSPAPINRKS